MSDARPNDARFEDGIPTGPDMPLRLMAQDAGDIAPISALLQDAVFAGSDVGYVAARRRLALLVTRFRWEDSDAATAAARPFERVRALLVVENITALRRAGFDPKDKAAVHALLSIGYSARDDLGGTLTLVLAGGGAIAVDIETVDLTLRDVARPHLAQSGRRPNHDI
jgi:hypothetical protein